MKRPKRSPREFSLSNLFSKNSPFSWRAFFAFVTTMTLTTILLCVGRLTETHWVEITQWIVGFFMTGETVKKFARGSAEELGNPTQGSAGEGYDKSNLQ